MVPDIFANYFLASAGAGAALIGLLFVAVSIHPERTIGDTAHPLRQGVASAAFTALVNAFFVSMAALIPLTNVGTVAIIVGAADLAVTLALARGLLRENWRARWSKAHPAEGARVLAMICLSLLLYGYEAVVGARLVLHPHESGNILTLTEIILGVYVVGLMRAWELLGAPRGNLVGWLNPLQDLPDALPASESSAQPPAP